jgi:hypothetical protein
MSAHAEDMVLVPRAELEALRAGNRRLRREAGDREALRQIRTDSGDGRTVARTSPSSPPPRAPWRCRGFVPGPRCANIYVSAATTVAI